eukprot:CAMPEP_0117022644 /NCGR_PEP_ID=MMETSP0472-20121206/16995_1 /TAXON_ID=693140 ORGANISM="Tiarina fusus, Strain LIS" /NCGR_SAMPLE_ID=MMETSP0472 /ASSEMBLY_ACC=CAM_ASM_000603 /LENGTH=223 /DNA_ID=CAMNT_0004728561 /DNA_START=2615 /DNA_END=3286 /DNA_ORIENTATION=+
MNSFATLYVFTPLRNSFVVKSLLWILFGEQRSIRVGNYGMDIRPAVMIRGNETVYALKHGQDYAVWIKNFSPVETLCTLSIKSREIGKFSLSPFKSYLIEHPGNMIRFKFNGQSLDKDSCAVEACFTPAKNNLSVNNVEENVPEIDDHLVSKVSDDVSSTLVKREEPEENAHHDEPVNEEQVECFSFDQAKGVYSRQTFQTLRRAVQWDTSRSITISTRLVRA